MWTSHLNKRDADLIQHHLERLFEIDYKVNFLNPTEYNELCDLLNDVKEYRKKFS